MPFATYPEVMMYDKVGGKKIQQLIWGDYIAIKEPVKKKTDEEGEEWVYVRSRRTNGWVKTEQTLQDRLLEVNFVDVGQGDGCFIVTPDDELIIIDAGEEDHMYRFLKWRFSDFKKGKKFQSIVISHGDKDHYYGFNKLFEDQYFDVETIYHNGIVDRVTNDELGKTKLYRDERYLKELMDDPQDMKNLVDDPNKVGRKLYPMTIRNGLSKTNDIKMLCQEKKHLGNYTNPNKLEIKVLGPYVERDRNKKMIMKVHGDTGETKNGNSIILKLIINKISILLGGDLNSESEKYLIHKYTNLDPTPDSIPELNKLLGAARKTFECDFAKACHHGSADFTETFLQCVNPVATIVSSGDDEPYCHPRPDALGAIGKYSRGVRPLIYSTELARSTKENVKQVSMIRQTIEKLEEKKRKETDETKKAAIEKKIGKEWGKLERSIAVYGMIYLRTDGEKAIIAQKLERPRRSSAEWDICEFKIGMSGKLEYIP
ncbi:MAG: ComEC/Rec2 family competence protein [Thermoplasmatota archaeon]